MKNQQTAGAHNTRPEDYYALLTDRINRDLAESVSTDFPPNLYNPMRYVLSAKGKRFRPVLLITACEAVGGDAQDAYDASLAIEILHNFTLVHDDIMDNDDLRRGRKTVHKKWNSNIAILAGDGLIALAYRFLLKTESPDLKRVIRIFSEAIINICEGQSLDKDMETASVVSMDDYLYMIERKTAVLISVSAKIGSILGGGTPGEVEALEKFGFELGVAFQIQDDLLDIVSEEGIIGKDLGSDLAQGKKTYPVIMLLDSASPADIRKYNDCMSAEKTGSETISRTKALLEKYGIPEKTQHVVNERIDRALTCLKSGISSLHCDHLGYLAERIRNRTF